MTRTRHSYSIRLSVEDGGRVRAELAQIGEGGERSFKRIRTASSDASRSLETLAGRASGLQSRMRMLAGVVAGLTAAGGLTALVNRSITTADAIGKTADKIGVGVESLQALRYAAESAGISQNTLDMSLQRFTRRVAEAASGSGEAKDALAQMGITLRDQHGQIRKTEDLLLEVADALSKTENSSERVRLAFKLFDSGGVGLINMLRGGSDALEQTMLKARGLGIVIEEDLIRNAEQARDDLDTLSKVISANLNRALLDLAPLISDASSAFATFFSTVGKGYQQLFGDPSDDERFNTLLAKRLRLQEQVAKLVGRSNLHPIARNRLASFKAEIIAINEQLRTIQDANIEQAKRESQAQPLDASSPDPASGEEGQLQSAKERARKLAQLERTLQQQLFSVTQQGAARIEAEYQRHVEQLGQIRTDQNRVKVDQLLGAAADVRSAKLAQLAAQEQKLADQRYAANQRVVTALKAEQDALSQTDRQRFISQAQRRLSAEATAQQRAEVEQLAAMLFDEKQAIEAQQQAEEKRLSRLKEGKALTEQYRTAQEQYRSELSNLNELLAEGAINQQTFSQAVEQAHDRMLDASTHWSDGIQRAIRDYLDEASNAAQTFEQVTSGALRQSENAFVQWAMTGKLSATDLFNTIAEEAIRTAYRMALVKPLGGFMESLFSTIGSAIFGGIGIGGGTAEAAVLTPKPGMSNALVYHSGGVVGSGEGGARLVPASLYEQAPRYHGGGVIGPGEVPAVLQQGETVFTRGQMQLLGEGFNRKPEVKVMVNIHNNAENVEAKAQWQQQGNGDLTLDVFVDQVESRMNRNIGRGEGIAPTLERRYGLNPAVGSYR
ncbi:phage tail tape measure C-terminal domain-containing protein [Magnetococcus sp. PR-3]|uniref:phage tail tape measure C-terminal domain-containing protein n=1 Tax=Magnetococcus sp. PR-3 TaxID=3120355 RepID=UPI002FCDFFC8